MKRLVVRTAFVVFLLSTKSHAQSGAAIPQDDGGHASPASCVIVKRMGRMDRSKSRLYSFGIHGKEFRYVEGKLPEGFSLHRKMTDHDVRNLQAKGAQVLVLDTHYTPEDLKEARAGCGGESGKTLNQAEAKALPAPAGGAVASNPASQPIAVTPKAPPAKATTSETPAPKREHSAFSADTREAALLDVTSTPPEAEVYVDEQLSGHTPSTLILMPGDHKVVIKKNGFVTWKRKFNLPSGVTSVDAALIRKAK